jgi:hypothetical protein
MHPNVHQAWQSWSEGETLHLAVAYSNPFRWQSRRRLFNDFKFHMERMPNVKLYIGELAYGDRPFEVTADCNPNHIQLRTNSELFHKENVLNKVIERFSVDWKYGGYCDADFTFTRHDWALEAIHQLQHHAFVQPFSTYANLTARGFGGEQPGRIRKGFVRTYIDNGHKLPPMYNPLGWAVSNSPTPPPSYADNSILVAAPKEWIPVGATGGAWTFTRDAFNTVGGLLDRCILGHADWFMAFGLVSQPTRGMQDDRYHSTYVDYIHAWQEKAAQLKQNIGVVDQFVVHHFHGAMKNRGYESRDELLVKHRFDPTADLRKNWQGIYELTGNKPALRDAIRRYFVSRNEDDPSGE